MSTARRSSKRVAAAAAASEKQAARRAASSSPAAERKRKRPAGKAKAKASKAEKPKAGADGWVVKPQESNPAFPRDGLTRCEWCLGSGKEDIMRRYVAYHDTHWGVPERDERRMFEMLTLEGAQAGLSWETVLRKMESYREAFDGWDVDAIARYDEARVAELLQNPGIVRNRLKVNSTVINARLVVAMRDEVPFSEFCWSFVGGEPQVSRHERLKDVPLVAAPADALSKALKKRGFKFVGPTIVTSFMQACGLVNDHVLGCHRHPDRLAEAAAGAGAGGDVDGPAAKRPRK